MDSECLEYYRMYSNYVESMRNIPYDYVWTDINDIRIHEKNTMEHFYTKQGDRYISQEVSKIGESIVNNGTYFPLFCFEFNDSLDKTAMAVKEGKHRVYSLRVFYDMNKDLEKKRLLVCKINGSDMRKVRDINAEHFNENYYFILPRFHELTQSLMTTNEWFNLDDRYVKVHMQMSWDWIKSYQLYGDLLREASLSLLEKNYVVKGAKPFNNEEAFMLWQNGLYNIEIEDVIVDAT